MNQSWRPFCFSLKNTKLHCHLGSFPSLVLCFYLEVFKLHLHFCPQLVPFMFLWRSRINGAMQTNTVLRILKCQNVLPQTGKKIIFLPKSSDLQWFSPTSTWQIWWRCSTNISQRLLQQFLDFFKNLLHYQSLVDLKSSHKKIHSKSREIHLNLFVNVMVTLQTHRRW